MPKILVIIGPTAVGKSDLAVRLAKKFNGEIISADSRQIYIGLDIGTGKVSRDKTSKSSELKSKSFFYKDIPHHLLDVASPKRKFSVAQYKKLAERSIRYIVYKNKKLPIIVGGTGFYIQALVDNLNIPEVPPNFELRKKLEKKSTEELFKILKKMDSVRAKSIDSKNPRRLIRAIEIAKQLGKVPPRTPNSALYTTLFIGLDLPDKKLKEKIKKRLLDRMKIGMVAEAKKLHRQGLSYKRMEDFGLEYRFLAKHLKGELTKEEMVENLNTAIWQFAKRQRTWFKRDKRILWFRPNEQKKIEKKVKDFLEI